MAPIHIPMQSSPVIWLSRPRWKTTSAIHCLFKWTSRLASRRRGLEIDFDINFNFNFNFKLQPPTFPSHFAHKQPSASTGVHHQGCHYLTDLVVSRAFLVLCCLQILIPQKTFHICTSCYPHTHTHAHTRTHESQPRCTTRIERRLHWIEVFPWLHCRVCARSISKHFSNISQALEALRLRTLVAALLINNTTFRYYAHLVASSHISISAPQIWRYKSS